MSFKFVFIFIIWIDVISVNSVLVTNIINVTYSIGSPFAKMNLTISNICMCSCIAHPHCLSINIITITNTNYYCQLFATYPIQISQLSLLVGSNVTIYTDRVLSSVYLNNGLYLSNPQNLSFGIDNPWIPIFKLYTGNDRPFLWLNSSNLTTLTNIPMIPINQLTPHWFSVLISQWNQGSYIPNQVSIAFIVNHTIIFDFLIFNASQTNISNWFSTTNFISNQFWNSTQFKTTLATTPLMTAVYSDSDCIRSFNCNFKYSTSGCGQDFTGFFFVYGGYGDLCVMSASHNSQIAVPTIYFSPTKTFTNGSLSNFLVADGIMGFVR